MSGSDIAVVLIAVFVVIALACYFFAPRRVHNAEMSGECSVRW